MVIYCRICGRKVAGSNLGRGYCAVHQGQLNLPSFRRRLTSSSQSKWVMEVTASCRRGLIYRRQYLPAQNLWMEMSAASISDILWEVFLFRGNGWFSMTALSGLFTLTLRSTFWPWKSCRMLPVARTTFLPILVLLQYFCRVMGKHIVKLTTYVTL